LILKIFYHLFLFCQLILNFREILLTCLFIYYFCFFGFFSFFGFFGFFGLSFCSTFLYNLCFFFIGFLFVVNKIYFYCKCECILLILINNSNFKFMNTYICININIALIYNYCKTIVISILIEFLYCSKMFHWLKISIFKCYVSRWKCLC